MPGAAYIDDVFTLVEALNRPDLAALARQFEPDTDGSFRIDISVYVGADDLRSALAVQQLLQLSVDSASIVVESWDRVDPYISRDEIESILRDRLVELSIVRLSDGSFLAKYTINPKNPQGRKRLLAMAVVTVAALGVAAVIPPAAVAVVGALPTLADVLRPDPTKPPRDDAPSESPKVNLKTVDSEDVGKNVVRVEVAGPIHVYEIFVDGSVDARDVFLDRVRKLKGVEGQSRFVKHGSGAEVRLKVWSNRALNRDKLRALASETGCKVSGIDHGLTNH
jgi:hypothetical protein